MNNEEMPKPGDPIRKIIYKAMTGCVGFTSVDGVIPNCRIDEGEEVELNECVWIDDAPRQALMIVREDETFMSYVDNENLVHLRDERYVLKDDNSLELITEEI